VPLALEPVLASLLVQAQALVPVLGQVPGLALVLGSSRRSTEQWCRLPAGYWF